MNAKNEDGLLAKRILTEFMDEFQARNPNLYVFYIRMKLRHIYILILFLMLQEVSEDLIQGYH